MKTSEVLKWLVGLAALEVCSSCDVFPEEYRIMESFYRTRNGQSWNWANVTSPWYFPANLSDVCGFHGIMCHAEGQSGNCSIVGLNMIRFDIPGPFPLEFVGLKKMDYIVMMENHMTGTMPSEISRLSHLNVLQMDYNSFSGTLPSELFQFSGLAVLTLTYNHFTGTLPMFPTQCSTLSDISIPYNHVTGSLSSSIGNCDHLTSFYISYNQITGTLPSFFRDSLYLQFLYTTSNYFTGPLFSRVSTGEQLNTLEMDHNWLSGPLPYGFVGYDQLITFYLNFNNFNGRIPTELLQLSQVRYFYLSWNSITGTIPTDMGKMTSLLALTLSGNFLQGTIPTELSQLSNVMSIDFSENSLTGTLPAGLSLATAATQLIFNDNSLVGGIPEAWGSLPKLTILRLSANKLSGSLDENFRNTSMFPSLSSLHLERNAFTGSIPSGLFRLSTLQSVGLGVNCFHGTIPESICESASLNELVMDGLSASSACQLPVPSLLKPVVRRVFTRLLPGTLPSCLFAMPNLSFLHVAGNGLAGRLPDLGKGSRLVNISLSSNRLTGTIPLSMQQKAGALEQLDLSVNSINGVLSDSFNLSWKTNLNLTINRLSGDIPRQLQSNANAKLLNGNLFRCPSSDIFQVGPSKTSHASCGSDNLDSVMILWADLFCIVGGVALISVLLVYCTLDFDKCGCRNRHYLCTESLKWSLESTSAWWSAAGMLNQQDVYPECSRFLRLLSESVSTSAIILPVIICTVLPAYLVFKLHPSAASLYSTHSHQYSWVPTSAFLHGIAPVVVLFSVVFISITIVVGRLPFMLRKVDNSSIGEASKRRNLFGVMLSLMLHAVNIVVVLAVNYGYVTAVLAANPNLSFIQFAVSLFKICWALLFIPSAISLLRTYTGWNMIRAELFMRLFNVIIAPCIATAATDNSCFLNVFVDSTAIVTSFTETTFVFDPISETSVSLSEVSMTLSPPWLYSYQCGSAVLTNYIPVLLYMYAISCLIIPSIQYLLALIPWERINRSTFLKLVIRHVDTLWLGGLFVGSSETEGKPAMECECDAGEDPLILRDGDGSGQCKGSSSNAVLTDSNCSENIKWSSEVANEPIESFQPQPQSQSPSRPLFRSQRVVTMFLQHLTILFTFGISSPVLAVAVVATLSVEYSLWKLFLGRCLSSASKSNHHMILERLELTVKDAWRGPRICLWMMTLVSGLFWGMLTYDMVADTNGSTSAFAVAIGATVGFPVMTALGLLSLRTFFQRSRYNGLLRRCRLKSSGVEVESCEVGTESLLSAEKPDI